jgi:protein phosphatase
MSRVRFREGCAYIVSGGLGTHCGGAKAAEMTVRTLERYLSAIPGPASIETTLREAFAAANSGVYESGHSAGSETTGMEATAVVCVTSGASVLVAHIGDSRAYLHRRRHLRRLTRDHTRAQSMVGAGILSVSEADTHPAVHVLTRAIGHEPTVEIGIGDWVRLTPGDEILLCSGGLYAETEDHEILEALGPNESPRRLADRLVRLALGKGGNDNVTVQLIRYGSRRAPLDWPPLRGLGS